MSGSTSTAARRIFNPETTRGQVLRFLVVGGTNTVATTIAQTRLPATPRAPMTMIAVIGRSVKEKMLSRR